MGSSAANVPAPEAQPASVLDRTLDLSAVSWATLGWVVVTVVAVAIRFVQLDAYALGPAEARHAFDAYSLFRGTSLDIGLDLPHTSPLFMLLQALGFFLFGATDATARIMPALLGLALVLLTAGLRPLVGRPAALGMAAMAAFSPTLVYASRTANPQIAVACLSLLLVVALLRAGLPETTAAGVRVWTLIAAVALGAMLASGPATISILLALAVGLAVALAVDVDRQGATRRAFVAIGRTPGAGVTFLAGLIATIVVLFTRLFSDLGAIVGVGETFRDWSRLLATGSNATSTQFFLVALVVYEPLAIAFAIVAAYRGRGDRPGGLPWSFFAGWLATALLLFTFSAGRAPEQAVHVALPLVLLGGAALGELFAGIDWRDTFHGRGGILAVALVGLVIGVIALLVLAGRIDTAPDRTAAIFQTLVVAVLVVASLGTAVVFLTQAERRAGHLAQPGSIALLVLALFLGIYVFRSTVMLNFYDADDGSELLAQGTATSAVLPLVTRLQHLSRDVTVTQSTPRDEIGGHGLTFAVDKTVQWPLRWYFRDYPNFAVVGQGAVTGKNAQVAIAPDDTHMAESGYTPRQYQYLNGVPQSYAAPDLGTIAGDIVRPSHWLDDVHFLLYREVKPEAPKSLTVGLNAELSARVFPNSGPFNLLDRPGPGTGRGQFNNPRGIAVGPAGIVYVVDMGNARIERFDPSGQFVGIWGGDKANVAVQLVRTPEGRGPTGIAISPDGLLIYVADTWNHRVLVLDKDGNFVREIGARGKLTDNTDDPARVADNPGLFYGPRAVAVADDEIYVVDTGNERVQVFGKDGTFKRLWGGKGTGPGQLSEPVGIAFGPDGNVYVADSGNARISVFDRYGTPLTQWPVAAWANQQYFEPYLAFGRDGNLYATSSATGMVEVIGPDGKLLRELRDIGGDQLKQPIGITAAPDGALYISDAGRSAVFRYVPPAAAAPPRGLITGGSPAASPVASPAASPGASPPASPAVSGGRG